MEYPNSLTSLMNDVGRAPQTPVTNLAVTLIERAKERDLQRTERLGVHPKLGDIQRDRLNPPTINSPTILGADWADDEMTPLKPGEKWNAGRRASNTGTTYAFNDQGYPINPFFNTGLNGRGVLGQFGPNHAVDNGVLTIMQENGKPVLYALGIYRKDAPGVPAFAGGFAKFKKADDGQYIFDRATVVQSQVEEFFEEMISGSVPLLPEYELHAGAMIDANIAQRHAAGALIKEAHRLEIEEQVQTHLKMQQILDKDPEFLERLTKVIEAGKECFAGPVLNGTRSTNNAWIETRLSWFLLNEETWSYVRGSNPVFDYQLSAGDDADGVVFLKLDDKLIDTAFDSHGPMFVYMAASYLLDCQERRQEIPPSIIDQVQGIALSLV
jgi:hypothetical protein